MLDTLYVALKNEKIMLMSDSEGGKKKKRERKKEAIDG